MTVEMSNLGKRQRDFKLKGILLGYLWHLCCCALAAVLSCSLC